MLSTSILTDSASTTHTASTRAYNYKPSQGIPFPSTLTTSKITSIIFKGTLMAFTTFSRPLRKSALCMYHHYDFVYFCFTFLYCNKKNPASISVGEKTEIRAFSLPWKGSQRNSNHFSLSWRVRNSIYEGFSLPWRFRNGISTVFIQNKHTL
jgi:hypothetical protein